MIKWSNQADASSHSHFPDASDPVSHAMPQTTGHVCTCDSDVTVTRRPWLFTLQPRLVQKRTFAWPLIRKSSTNPANPTTHFVHPHRLCRMFVMSFGLL